MKKIVIVCGLIAGFITTAWTVGALVVSGGHVNFENGMFYGYASMILGLSIIFVAVKNYRDNRNGGIIGFGKAFQIGFFITLVASTIYVLTWLITYFNFMQDFDEKYTEYIITSMQKAGATQMAIETKRNELNAMWVSYQNPLICALFTYMEILPVGLAISLLAALFLKRKTKPQESLTV